MFMLIVIGYFVVRIMALYRINLREASVKGNPTVRRRDVYLEAWSRNVISKW